MQNNLINENGFNKLKFSKYGYCLYNKNDMYVGKSIDFYGEYCDDESKVLMQLCKVNDVVVEVGANIGTHTMMLAKHIGKNGRIYAFEPQRLIFQTLCANIALNSISNAFTYQAGVGNENGVIIIPFIDYEKLNNFGGVELSKTANGEKVQLVKLDDFLDIPSLKLIKIDVEGMEKDVIQGSIQLISKFKPAIYLENDRKEKSKELIELLWSLGYELYWHLPHLFSKNNFFKVVENKIGNFVSVNMMCIHKNSNQYIEGFEKVVNSSYHPFAVK